MFIPAFFMGTDAISTFTGKMPATQTTMMMQIPNNTKGLIFDLDGTLVDSMPVHKIAWQEVCAAKGFEFTDEIFYKYAGVPSEEIFRIINRDYKLDFDPQFHSKLKEEAYIQRLGLVEIIPEVVEVVRRYFGKLPLSIGTGSPKRHSLEVVKKVGLDQYFEILVSKEDVENGKPAPDTFLRCAELMQVAPEFCVVFEDGDAGIEAARRAGMSVIDVRESLNGAG